MVPGPVYTASITVLTVLLYRLREVPGLTVLYLNTYEVLMTHYNPAKTHTKYSEQNREEAE